MKKAIKAVIFDWAGTMIDFGCMAPVNAFIRAFEQKQITITIKEAREPMGLAKRDHVKAILGIDRVKNEWVRIHNSTPEERDIDEIYELVTPIMMLEIQRCNEPIEGIVEVIKTLKLQEIKIGSTTGYIDVMMEKILPIAASQGIVLDSNVNSSECKEGRPAPFMIFKNMENLGIYDVSEVLKIGDTVADVGEGLNAKVWTVAVVNSSNEVGLTKNEFDALNPESRKLIIEAASDKLKKAGAHFVINDMSEIFGIIDQINAQLNL
jgi:phosphonoacetaldehyde hydrolase